MIEDVNFTKKIIQAVADHPRFPARMTQRELADQLQLPMGRDNLLHGDCDTVKTFLTTEYIIHIDGLTHIGSEYAHHMKGALWNKAIDWCKKQGIPLTTKVAVKYVMDALGGEG